MSDPHVGHLTYIRVYSGVASSGTQVLNANRDRKQRLGRLLQMHANKRQDLDEVRAGDIAAVVGLKQIATGETLCDMREPIVLESLQFPEPVISIAIEPKTTADLDKLATSLERLSQEDPSFRVSVDDETGQTIISGMGELHLEIITDRLVREFGVRRQRRQAAGRLPREHHEVRHGRGPLHQADRRLRRLRSGQDRSEAGRAGLGLSRSRTPPRVA